VTDNEWQDHYEITSLKGRIDALDMDWVPMDATPHASHRFGKKDGTVVRCASNDRFGTIRACKGCGGREVWAGGAGSHYFDSALKHACAARKGGS
jgi:hypothetical protein